MMDGGNTSTTIIPVTMMIFYVAIIILVKSEWVEHGSQFSFSN